MDEMGLGDNTALIEAYGEALICRAYAHFMLVNIFSMQYNEKTSSTDLGVPYITEPGRGGVHTGSRPRAPAGSHPRRG